MMGDALKGQGASLTLQIKGGGPLGTVLAVSDHEGNVRGYVTNPQVDLPLRPDGKLDVGGAVGHEGTLTVIKDLHMKEPYVGTHRPAGRRDRRGRGGLLRGVGADSHRLRSGRAGGPRPEREVRRRLPYPADARGQQRTPLSRWRAASWPPATVSALLEQRPQSRAPAAGSDERLRFENSGERSR